MPFALDCSLITDHGFQSLAPHPSRESSEFGQSCTFRLFHFYSRFAFHSAGGSPAAGHFSCAAKKSTQKKAAQVSRLLFEEVTLRCLTR